MKRKWIALLLCAALALPLSGCGRASGMEAENLMEGITAREVDVQNVDGAQAVMAFSVDLFQGSLEEGSNVLISPLSVLCALAMTANGAQGDTLTQMEQVLGLTAQEMNCYLSGYLTALADEEACQLANSIWFRDVETLQVEQDFLQTNADYYGADIYKAAFDESTLKDINRWVSEGTDGMIQEILDEIPSDAVMYLVNALAFDAKWEDIYEESQISTGTFTLQDGTRREVEMMHSTESVYLQDENAVGVLKYYEGERYAFVALLPDEDVTVADYVASLTGERLTELLDGGERTPVKTTIPQFESEYSVEISEVLKALGMTDAFDGILADFSALGHSDDGNIFISRVLHKTYISVDEAGTKAGAATVVEFTSESAEFVEEPKTVCLDRPFVYMILDCESGIPLFIGTMMDTQG